MRIVNRELTKFNRLVLLHRRERALSVRVFPSHVEDTSEDSLVYLFNFNDDGTVTGMSLIYEAGAKARACT